MTPRFTSGWPSLRLVARVDEVAGERELAPAAEREAVHRRDDRERRRLDSLAERVPEVGERPRLGGGHLAHRSDVRPRRERLVPRAGQDRAAHLAVGPELDHGVEQLAQERDVDRVQLVRAVQGDRRDVPFARDEDRLVASPWSDAPSGTVPLVVVDVEAAPRLSSEPAGRDEVLEEGRRAVLVVAELAVQDLAR